MTLILSVLLVFQLALVQKSFARSNAPAPSLVVIGSGECTDGRAYCILDGYGLAAEGEEISIETHEAVYRFKIVSIRLGEVKVVPLGTTVKTLQRTTDLKPKAKKLPGAPEDGLRDPFWPINYKPGE
ncbi:MAG: hypothetical protein JXR37_00830 [Kiritimatiellae bacterium]|nr:hypothetical protein [Kiritimatiellia bacterium]